MLAAALLTLAAIGNATPPSVVIFVLDDVAQADTDLLLPQGKMPHLAALAGEGVTFTNAYANPTCAPSRWSLQTGHWQVFGFGDPCALHAGKLQLSERFLPEEVPASISSAMIGKWHLGSSPTGLPWACAPWEHGWDHSYALLGANVTECMSGGYNFWTRGDDCSITLSTQYQPRAACDIVSLGWSKVSGQKLAMVCPNLAHIPFHRPPPNLLPIGYPPTVTSRERFESMIVALDTLLGQMRAAAPDAIFVVLGDNGTPSQVAQPFQQKAKGTTYERGVRVPLVIGGPGIVHPGRESDELVHLVDVYETVRELMHGSPQVPVADGLSLAPILADQPMGLHHPWIVIGNEWTTAGGDGAAINSAGVKLRWEDADGDPPIDVEELYDLTLDPTETVNLVADPNYLAELTTLRGVLLAELP